MGISAFLIFNFPDVMGKNQLVHNADSPYCYNYYYYTLLFTFFILSYFARARISHIIYQFSIFQTREIHKGDQL
jgi:hypothetical protein